MKKLIIVLGGLVLTGVVAVVAVSLWFTADHVTTVTTNTTPEVTIKTSDIENALTNTSIVLSSTATLDELVEPHLTTAVSATMIADIQNETKYSTSAGFSLVTDCGASANADILKQIDATRKVQVVNVVYPIVRTPNPQHWTAAQAKSFMDNPTVVCGVGSFYPFDVQADAILWRTACSSGLMPSMNDGPAYLEFVQCIQAQEVVSRQYGLTD